MKRLWHILKSKFIRNVEDGKIVEVRVHHVPSHVIRLAQWRKDDKLVVAAAALEKNQTYQMEIQILKNEHPVHLIFASIGVNPSDRLAHQSKCEGYELAINNLEAMSKPLKLPERLESTFEPLEKLKK